MVEIDQQEAFEEEPIDNETAEKWVGAYVRDYGELPSESFEKSHHHKLEIPRKEEMMMVELAAILRLRPKFLGYWKAGSFVSRVGATPGQIEWLRKVLR